MADEVDSFVEWFDSVRVSMSFARGDEASDMRVVEVTLSDILGDQDTPGLASTFVGVKVGEMGGEGEAGEVVILTKADVKGNTALLANPLVHGLGMLGVRAFVFPRIMLSPDMFDDAEGVTVGSLDCATGSFVDHPGAYSIAIVPPPPADVAERFNQNTQP